MDTSDLILQFCSITSADPDKAESYLQVSDYNVERAIELYFETGGMDLSGPPPTHAPPPVPTNRSPSPPQVIDVDELPDLVETEGSSGPNIEDDEAFARRLMEEEVNSSGASGVSTGNDDGVRSPIRARNDILVHPDEDYDSAYPYAPYPRRGRGGPSRGIFNQAAPSIWNADDPMQSLADATGGSSEASDKAGRLAQMYRRPFEIMHHVSLDEARDEVRAEEPMKWIMVNIMNSQEFSCQILNRDLWSNDQVQKTIRENFYFLQFTHEEPEGVRYQRRYPFDKHPHIGIIDPRTGEQVKTWNQVISPAEFIFEMHEFLERFSLSEEARNPIGRKNKVTKDFSMMSEEEQMEAALAASLGNDPAIVESSPSSRPGTAQETEMLDTTTTREPSIPQEISASQKTPSLFSSIQPSSTPEPPQSPETTRIQFRFPEGARPMVRRFKKTDTIRDVFAFVKGLRTDEEEFELVFVGRRLLAEAGESGEGLDKGITEAGLANGSLTVEV